MEAKQPASLDYPALVKKLEQRLRLKTFPVGLRLMESVADLDRIPFLRRPSRKVTFCQLINQARNFNLTVGAELDHFLFPACPSILGLCEVPATHRDGSFRSIAWTSTKEEAARYEASIPRIPSGRFAAVALAPLVHNAFEPHLALIYANPAQVVLIINALQFKDYEVMQFFCVGESSCSDAIARCYLTGKPALSLPCFGERRFGHVQDDEITLALPPQLLPKVVAGLDLIYRRGVRYPIAYAGAEADFTPSWPATYFALDGTMAALMSEGRRLLVALTGGEPRALASVAEQFAELGARVIDRAALEVQLLAPGHEVGQAIADLIGPEVLAADGAVDPAKLRPALAQDPARRKQVAKLLEKGGFSQLCQRVRELATQEPEAVIVVVSPQVINQNEMYQFDRIVVAQGAGAGADPAGAGLFAHHLLDTDAPLDLLREQVAAVWRDLKAFQAQRNQAAGEGDQASGAAGSTVLRLAAGPQGGDAPWEVDLGVAVDLVREAAWTGGQLSLTLGSGRREAGPAPDAQALLADYGLEFAFATRAEAVVQGWPRWTFRFDTTGLTSQGIVEKMAAITQAHGIEMARLAVAQDGRRDRRGIMHVVERKQVG